MGELHEPRKKCKGELCEPKEEENMSAAIALQKEIEKLNQKEIRLVSKYINGLINSKNETKIIKKINLNAYQNPKKRKNHLMRMHL